MCTQCAVVKCMCFRIGFKVVTIQTVPHTLLHIFTFQPHSQQTIFDTHAHTDPALIGKAFVRQYYTQMHKDPSQMHRFYLEQSSFVHGGSEIGSEEPVIGQTVLPCINCSGVR